MKDIYHYRYHTTYPYLTVVPTVEGLVLRVRLYQRCS